MSPKDLPGAEIARLQERMASAEIGQERLSHEIADVRSLAEANRSTLHAHEVSFTERGGRLVRLEEKASKGSARMKVVEDRVKAVEDRQLKAMAWVAGASAVAVVVVGVIARLLGL